STSEHPIHVHGGSRDTQSRTSTFRVPDRSPFCAPRKDAGGIGEWKAQQDHQGFLLRVRIVLAGDGAAPTAHAALASPAEDREPKTTQPTLKDGRGSALTHPECRSALPGTACARPVFPRLLPPTHGPLHPQGSD